MVNYYITKEGYEFLSQAISNVDDEYQETRKKMGESCKRDSDLRENPEYMELRVQAMYTLPQKRRDLILKYKTAKIIEETDEYKNFDGLTVIRGSEVSLTMDGEELCYKILGSDEGDLENNILSCDTPIAKALLGRRQGEAFIFNDIKIVILSIEKIESKVKKK